MILNKELWVFYMGRDICHLQWEAHQITRWRLRERKKPLGLSYEADRIASVHKSSVILGQKKNTILCTRIMGCFCSIWNLNGISHWQKNKVAEIKAAGVIVATMLLMFKTGSAIMGRWLLNSKARTAPPSGKVLHAAPLRNTQTGVK